MLQLAQAMSRLGTESAFEVLARAKALDEEAAARRGSAYAGEPDPYKKPREDDEDDEAQVEAEAE